MVGDETPPNAKPSLRGCALAQRLIQAAALVDRLRCASCGREPIRMWIVLGREAQHLQPQLHTQKHPTMLRQSLLGGKINSFLFFLPLCQMTQIICAAVTQCLAENKCMRGVYVLHRPWIFFFFLFFVLFVRWTPGALISNHGCVLIISRNCPRKRKDTEEGLRRVP